MQKFIEDIEIFRTLSRESNSLFWRFPVGQNSPPKAFFFFHGSRKKWIKFLTNHAFFLEWDQRISFGWGDCSVFFSDCWRFTVFFERSQSGITLIAFLEW
jgi:hypothetical protein